MLTLPSLSVAFSCCFFSIANAETVVEKKVHRVIQVSAAYFDLNPWNEPQDPQFRVSLKTPFSFLPKIPDKEFEQNMPFVHAIPVVVLNNSLWSNDAFRWTVGSWFGTLIPGIEHIVGVKASPRQWLVGGSTQVQHIVQNYKLWSELGLQTARTHVSGIEKPIRSEIETQSLLQWFGVGIKHQPLGLWMSGTLGLKDTNVNVAGEEDVSLHEHDRLSDSQFPFWMVASVGLDCDHWQFAFSEVWLPLRLTMPRVMISYRFGVEFEESCGGDKSHLSSPKAGI